MRKFILFSAVFTLFAWNTQAQQIYGKITNAQTGAAVAFANVLIEGTKVATVSDAKGSYTIDSPPNGDIVLSFSAIGFETQKVSLTYTGEIIPLNISLEEKRELLEAVDINALRATSNTPIAQSNLDQAAIEKRNEGRDVPYILKDLPATVVSSDAGTGIGYTNLRIRGSDVSRINVTINGVPLNDPESQGVFWVNTPDLATSTQSIQVQRGVGTSTNGAGAFGASVNLQTTGIQAKPSASLNLTGGSFNTFKRNVNLNSGLINEHWNVEARLSQITSDGFIDRASANLQSYYLSAAYVGEKTSIQFIHFGGSERTYQAWWGIPEARLNGDSLGVETHIINNGLDTVQASNLRRSGNRTYNFYEYENQVDDYGQRHYQLHLRHNFNSKLRANVALHYTKGGGFFEEFKTSEDLADYNLSNLIIGGDTITESDLIRRRWLDNDFLGTTYSLTYSDNGLNLIYGGAYNEYRGDHFGELTWMQFAGDVTKDQRYYFSNSVKTDFNNYIKAEYQWDKLILFADLQYRQVSYTSNGNDNDQTVINIDRNFNFFNPKAGISYRLDNNNQFFASYGVAQREPTRSDIIDAPTGRAPESEYLGNLEAGYLYNSTKARLSSNVYWMQYRDQLVPTGEVNDVGSPIRINVPNSYRIGLELEGTYRINRWFQFGANMALSQNKITDYEYYVAASDANFDFIGYDTTRFDETDIAFSPSLIFGSAISFFPFEGMDISLIQKYVGRQYMDNTGSVDRSLDPFNVVDLRLEYTLEDKLGLEAIRFNLLVANMLSEVYEPNGYTFSYIVDNQLITENFYYPMAGINFLGGITLSL